MVSRRRIEHLKALALKCVEPVEPTVEPLNQPDSNALTVDVERFTSLNLDKKQALELIQKLRTERALQLKAKGWGKAKIILEVWGVSKGGSPKYKAAEAEYKRLVEEGG